MDSAIKPARFSITGCSQCGQSFGPGDHGFSHCKNHKGLRTLALNTLATPTREDEAVKMRRADTWVVMIGHWSRLLQKTLWSAETFFDLNEAVDCYGEVESGERDGILGSIVAFKHGDVIGPLPLRNVAAMVREGRAA